MIGYFKKRASSSEQLSCQAAVFVFNAAADVINVKSEKYTLTKTNTYVNLGESGEFKSDKVMNVLNVFVIQDARKDPFRGD